MDCQVQCDNTRCSYWTWVAGKCELKRIAKPGDKGPKKELSLEQTQTGLGKMVLQRPYLVNTLTQRKKYFVFSPLLERIPDKRLGEVDMIPA